MHRKERWKQLLDKRNYQWYFGYFNNLASTFIVKDRWTLKEFPILFYDKPRRLLITYEDIGCSYANLRALRDYYLYDWPVEIYYYPSSVTIRKKFVNKGEEVWKK